MAWPYDRICWCAADPSVSDCGGCDVPGRMAAGGRGQPRGGVALLGPCRLPGCSQRIIRPHSLHGEWRILCAHTFTACLQRVGPPLSFMGLGPAGSLRDPVRRCSPRLRARPFGGERSGGQPFTRLRHSVVGCQLQRPRGEAGNGMGVGALSFCRRRHERGVAARDSQDGRSFSNWRLCRTFGGSNHWRVAAERGLSCCSLLRPVCSNMAFHVVPFLGRHFLKRRR